SPAEALELLGVLEELDDFHHLFLGLFNSGHIVEGNVGVFFRGYTMARAPEVSEHSTRTCAVAQLAEYEEPDERENQQPGNQRDDDRHQQILAIFGHDIRGPATLD